MPAGAFLANGTSRSHLAGVRAALFASAGLLLGWGMLGTAFRDAQGALSGAAVLPFGGALLLVMNAAAVGSSLAPAARWFGLLVIGQAAQLQLVNAGRGLHYQHLVSSGAFWTRSPVATVVLLTQLIIVVAVLAGRRGRMAFPVSLRGWRMALLAAALVLLSATPSVSARAYVEELFTAGLLQFLALVTLALGVSAIPSDVARAWRGRVERALAARPELPLWKDPVVVGAALAVLAVSSFLCVFVYQRHPHVQDEVKYLYQARYFARGMLAMPPPPVPEAFQMYLMDIGPRGWYSVVPPGWPAVLAIGMSLGAAWLVNPFLSALNVVLAARVLEQLYDRRMARLTAILLAVSPWYVFLAMSFMSHPLTLTCALLGVLGVMRSRDTGQSRWTWLAGAAVGYLSIVRQLDAMIVALLLGLWAIGLGGRRLRLPAILSLVIATAATASTVFAYNAYFMGKATVFPIMAYNDRLYGPNSNAYGFGRDRGMGWELDPFPGHGPIDATVNAALNATAMNVELLGWVVGPLLFVLLSGLGRQLGRSDRLMWTTIGVVWLAYFFNYFGGGPDFGARYWYLMLLPALVLVVRGFESLGPELDPTDPVAGHGRSLAAMATLSLAALVVFFPWRAFDKYHYYLNMRPDLRELASAGRFGSGLVIVRGRDHPDYTSAAIYNPIDLQSAEPVFVRAPDSVTVANTVRAFWPRQVWIVDGPTVTGGAYRVAVGPLAPDPERIAALARQ